MTCYFAYKVQSNVLKSSVYISSLFRTVDTFSVAKMAENNQNNQNIQDNQDNQNNLDNQDNQNNHFVVLERMRKFLEIINLINENAIFHKLKIPYEIPNWLFSCIYLFMLTIQIILSVLFCIHVGFELNKSIWPLSLSIAAIQMISIYFCLFSNKNRIIDMLAQLQRLVNESK